MISRLTALPFLLVAPTFPQGISSEWDVRKTVDSLASQVKRIQPILEQVRPDSWTGASETYLTQWKSTRQQLDGVQVVLAHLGREPERLTTAFDAFLRLQNLDLLLGSLGDGLRRYQNPALADLLAGIVAEGGAQRLQLRQYVQDLASLKEQELAVMDREAQLCRAAVSRQPRPAAQKKVEGTPQK
jgi:hypothetical protein